MPRIPFPTEDDLDEQARTLLEQVEDVHGFVPNQHRLDAYLPLVLRSLLDLSRRVLLTGDLEPDFLETVALIVAVQSDCEYCVAYHLDVLEGQGRSTAELEAILDDWRTVGFPTREAALIELAVTVVDDPHGVNDEDLDRLFDLGYSAADLVQLVHFVNLMRGYNAFNVVFQTDPDDERGGWMDRDLGG